MNAIVRRATILLALLAVAATAWPVLGADGSTGSRYIVVLKSGTKGALGITDAEVATLGGRIEVRLPTRLEVTLPDRAADVLRNYPAVKYLQRVSTDGRFAEEVSAGQSSVMRLHPKTMVVDPPSWTSGTFRYDGSGNIYTIGVAGEAGVTSHTYTYDNLSRLTQATNVATQTEKFSYDIYGNMTEHDIGSVSTMIPLDSANNNRLQAAGGVIYDPVGNLASDATAIYTYDPFSQLREKDFSGSTDGEIYLYTPDDERIAVKQNDTWTWSIRDFGGKVLRQYQSSASQPSASWLWMEDYVYRDGLLLGANRPAEEGGRRYMHLDQLGTPRLVTGASGVKVAEHELAPFGIEPTPLWEDTTHGFDREDPMRFTGHERDFAQLSRMVTTPYLDYMHARSYNPNGGRFLSVDPMRLDDSDPQSFNRYAYVANNPTLLTDPYGLFECAGVSGCVDDITVRADAFKASGVWGSMGDDILVRRIMERDQRERDRNQGERDRIINCVQRNGFASMIGDVTGSKAAKTTAEILEVGGGLSFGADLFAIGVKAAGTPIGTNPYASGIDWGFRAFGRAIGNAKVGRMLVTNVGKPATGILAAIGVGTLAYNGSIAVQCYAGWL